MAYVRNTLCLIAAILLIYQKTATSSLLEPIFEKDNICKKVECGKGKCKESSNATFRYECECDNGWKQFDRNLKFLPCIIPNCTFGLTCGEAASPAQPKMPLIDNKASLLDICHWVSCGGGGVCNNTKGFPFRCDCREGYSNFLNIALLPCYKKLNFGIPTSPSSSSPPPPLPNSSKNQAAGMSLRGSSLWWITSLLCVSLAPWRLLYI